MTRRLICGVGVNDADYVIDVRETIGHTAEGKQIQNHVWRCPYYAEWNSMLSRGHSEKRKIRNPHYTTATVNEEWHLFSRFRAWMVEQPYQAGMKLDKDVLLMGNAQYSSDTCRFVPVYINNLLVNCRKSAKDTLPLGVSFHANSSKFRVRCRDENSKEQHLGMRADALEGHRLWQKEKARVIGAMVNKWQFDPETSHSFSQDVAMSLFDRVEILTDDYNAYRETTFL